MRVHVACLLLLVTGCADAVATEVADVARPTEVRHARIVEAEADLVQRPIGGELLLLPGGERPMFVLDQLFGDITVVDARSDLGAEVGWCSTARTFHTLDRTSSFGEDGSRIEGPDALILYRYEQVARDGSGYLRIELDPPRASPVADGRPLADEACAEDELITIDSIPDTGD